eukprot:Plantae.Rhodophyta-Purpureofilum_apyrenoidigerum.ctg4884.p1 GENE.Plantae.Rhodophyta-Purpureofilum_apyrenoidigerum.ctg4884~~Plantae.Rhodophyta-Purpureofilum_apyrenoidigerum.ctg4884.p1  ORF type:complete len:539 (+),score=95.03 Plantae.Rhodophyta-Purpureofilum_apyrenoidigerum.ctg4884:88-1617(+)
MGTACESGAWADVAGAMEAARKFAESGKDELVAKLVDIVQLLSVSCSHEHAEQCADVLTKLQAIVSANGGVSNQVQVGYYSENNRQFPLPKALLAEFTDGSRKKPTLLVYGYYDVLLPDAATTTSTSEDLSGSADTSLGSEICGMKGHILPWLYVYEIYKEAGLEFPINLKILIEGLGESNSECLDKFIEHEAAERNFLSDIDVVITPSLVRSENEYPTLPHLLQGLVLVNIEVLDAKHTRHASRPDRSLSEPAHDVIRLLASLQDENGNFAPDHEMQHDELTKRDAIQLSKKHVEEAIDNIPLEDIEDGDVFGYKDMRISVLGIDMGNASKWSSAKAKNCAARFMIQVQRWQDPQVIACAVQRQLEKKFRQLNTGNILNIEIDINDAIDMNRSGPAFAAASSSLEKVYGKCVATVDSMPSITALCYLSTYTNADCAVIRMGSEEDNLNRENKSAWRSRYLEGYVLVATYVGELANTFGRKHIVPKCLQFALEDEGIIQKFNRLWSYLR